MASLSKEYYEFFCPVKMIAGYKALEHIPHELDSQSAQRTLIVTDQGVRGAGLVDIVTEALAAGGHKPVSIYDDVPPDSSTNTVSAIASVYRSYDCDSIIAIGGGSVIDTAKGVNILVSEGGDDIRDYSGAGVVKKKLRPFFVIPTTSGTGSEATLVSVIKDSETGLKLPFASQFLLPDAAVLDPRMTQSLPAKITAATAMDALTHATEAYTCLAKNPLSDAYATTAIKKITQNLPEVLKNPQDPRGRLELAQASTMAGIAFSNSMVGLVHSLGHSVGAIAHVPHGVCMSILLPFALGFNQSVNGHHIGELLLPLTSDGIYAQTPVISRANSAIEKIHSFKEELYQLSGLPRKLSEAGVKEGQLTEIAKLAIDDGTMIMNPIDLTEEEALTLLQKAF